MGREDEWEKLLSNDPGYAEWRQKELEQQEQEELEDEEEANNKD